MIVDIIGYWSTKPSNPTETVRQRLPESLKARLLQGKKFEYGIYASSDDAALIADLDHKFRIGARNDFVKSRYVEVDKRSLDEYPFYHIDPAPMDHSAKVFFDVSPHECSMPTCPSGARIVSPIRVAPRAAKRIGIAWIAGPWPTEVDLIVSAELRDLFEQENISGLRYEECEIGSATAVIDASDTKVYRATIIPTTCYRADEIVLRFPENYCSRHKMVTGPHIVNETMPLADMHESDFQTIKGVRVKDEEIVFFTPRWVISRRCLRLLLDHKVPGLGTPTWILNQKFRPLITS